MNNLKKKRANKNLVAVLVISGAIHMAVFLVLGSLVIFTSVPQSKPEFEQAIVLEAIELEPLQMKQDMSKMVRTGGSSGSTGAPQRNLIALQTPTAGLTPLAMSISPVMGMGTGSSIGPGAGMGTGPGGGFGSGTGDGLGGLGGRGGLGIGSRSVSFLGLQSGGERVAILVDCSDFMLEDGKGGMWAFRIVKDECVKLIQSLQPGVLFNVYLFSNNDVNRFKPYMVASTPSVVTELSEWIAPVNEDASRRGARTNNFTPEREYFNQRASADWGSRQNPPRPVAGMHVVANYGRALHAAMDDQAESIFMIIATFPGITRVMEDLLPRDQRDLQRERDRMDRDFESRMNRWKGSRDEDVWNEYQKAVAEAHAPIYKRAQEIWDAENARRAAAGQPPRIVVGSHLHTVMRENNLKLPGVPQPRNLQGPPHRPQPFHHYTIEQIILRFKDELIRDYYRMDSRAETRRREPSINIILFGTDAGAEQNWTQFVKEASRSRGQFRKITSLAEMKSAAEDSEKNRTQ